MVKLSTYSISLLTLTLLANAQASAAATKVEFAAKNDGKSVAASASVAASTSASASASAAAPASAAAAAAAAASAAANAAKAANTKITAATAHQDPVIKFLAPYANIKLIPSSYLSETYTKHLAKGRPAKRIASYLLKEALFSGELQEPNKSAIKELCGWNLVYCLLSSQYKFDYNREDAAKFADSCTSEQLKNLNTDAHFDALGPADIARYIPEIKAVGIELPK